jgi:hypothetical protein
MNTASLRFMRRLNRRLERRQASLPELETRPPELQVLEASDFASGGEAGFARAANARGDVIGKWQAGADETHTDFIVRAKHGGRALDAARLVIGGIPDLAAARSGPIRPAPRNAVAMPDGALHAGQIDALGVIQANRFVALRAGRRFGKSSLAAALAADVALLGGVAGLFAPIYKLASPLFDVLAMALAPVTASSNRSFGELRLVGGGGVDVWNLENVRAGRGRRYNLIVIDEAAFATPDLTTVWSASIRPTLADTQGSAIVASTPSGVAEDNFFWRVCNEKQAYGFAEFVAPTLRNPFIPREEVEALRAQHNPLVFSQEFEAQFVNLSGVGLFDITKLLNQGEPWPMPNQFDTVFAALDSGVRGCAGFRRARRPRTRRFRRCFLWAQRGHGPARAVPARLGSSRSGRRGSRAMVRWRRPQTVRVREARAHGIEGRAYRAGGPGRDVVGESRCARRHGGGG